MKIKINPVIAATLFASTLICSPAALAETAKASPQKAVTHFKTLLKSRPGFYPECKQPPTQVGKENFQKNHLSLSGLEGVHLDVAGLLKSAGNKKVKMIDKLEERIRQRLTKNGLKLLSKEEMKRIHGQPELNIYMTFPPHLTPAKEGKKPAPYRPDCCTMSTWTSFSQAAKVLRDPETNYKLSTWGEGHNTNDCSNPSGWMSQTILKTIDNFIAEKLKADKDYAQWLEKRPKPEPSAKISQLKKKIAQELAALQQPIPQPQPVQFTPPPATNHCNGAVRTYIDMFATNQVQIDHSNHYVLNELAASMRACPMYNYVIETHADPRSSHAYNERLTALRAASIQGYLLSQGVLKNRFVVQSYGELNPVSTGTSAMDYAANRRVVVRPYLHNRAN